MSIFSSDTGSEIWLKVNI